ncbi:unnamed protein product [Ilex paraguariensis]|uniref:Uncharacterized protein n=1 Tax=Ilex paraguariensis TaxID=185542 RepID=A0ABC8R8W9_9AQUA
MVATLSSCSTLATLTGITSLCSLTTAGLEAIVNKSALTKLKETHFWVLHDLHHLGYFLNSRACFTLSVFGLLQKNVEKVRLSDSVALFLQNPLIIIIYPATDLTKSSASQVVLSSLF